MVLDGMAGEVDEKQRTLLQRAYQNNERQLSIINNLLRVAQIDTGTVKLNIETVDLRRLIDDTVRDLRPLYEGRQQRLVFDTSIAVRVMADIDALRMMLDNLIENASKYSKSGATTTISVQIGADSVSIIIADQGVGVSSPDRLFTKFSRINNELSDVVEGTGIGLYWAQSIARLHNGSLTYEPNLPTGSKFIVSLPLS